MGEKEPLVVRLCSLPVLRVSPCVTSEPVDGKKG